MKGILVMIRFLSFAGIFLIITCIVFGILSCDPTYEYDFYVENTSARDITALIQVQDQKDHYTTQTDTLRSNTTKLVYTDESWGQTRNIAQPSDSVPAYTKIKSLKIAVKDSVCYQQDPVDFSKWQHTGILSGPGKSQYTFVVDSTVVHN
jgi:Tfp pilus assembly protein PilE